MFRHGRVMLQIKNLLIAGAVEITCLLRWQHLITRCFKIALILCPVSQTGCEKVAKPHFVDFDFDFLAKENGQRAHFDICYWSVNILDNPFKNKNSPCMEKGHNAMCMFILCISGMWSDSSDRILWIVGHSLVLRSILNKTKTKQKRNSSPFCRIFFHIPCHLLISRLNGDGFVANETCIQTTVDKLLVVW